MRRVFVVSLLLALAVTIVAATPALGQGEVAIANGQKAAGVDAVTPSVLTVEVRNTNGAVVSTLRRSNPWSYAMRGYWVRFGGGEPWVDATITFTISLVGLPDKTMVIQYHQDAPYAGWTATPFAITDWFGAAANGTCRITVVTSDGDNSWVVTRKYPLTTFS